MLASCSSVSNIIPFNSFDSKYGNRTDVCYYARKPLIESGDVFAHSIYTGAAIGGATGAAAGAIAAKDKVQGAIVGGVIGIAAGAAAGYLHAKQEQTKSRAELIASIDADAARDNRQLVTGSNAIASLTHCRQDQIASVERNYRSKAITSADARRQLTTIQAAVRDDNALIKDVVGKAVDRSTVYTQARAESGGGGGRHSVAIQPGQYVATANANVRSGPSTSGKVVDTLKTGEEISVVADAGNGWANINHNGVSGYVSRRMLAEPSSVAAHRADDRGGPAKSTPSTPPSAAVPSMAEAPTSSGAEPGPQQSETQTGTTAPPESSVTSTAASTPSVVSTAAVTPAYAGDNPTTSFHRSTEEALRREEAHKQIESELQTRISGLPAAG